MVIGGFRRAEGLIACLQAKALWLFIYHLDPPLPHNPTQAGDAETWTASDVERCLFIEALEGNTSTGSKRKR